MPSTPDVRAQLEAAVRAADGKGATAPVALEVGDLFPLADVFLLLSGGVERNVQAIAESIEDRLAGLGIDALRREGREGGRWVLLDFGDLIVHVFHQEERDFYQLERLWKDCPAIDVSPYLGGAADLQEQPPPGVE
ncbi:ribosome silencing factor [Leucobacter weissii]|uniref:Ribosomal silencing factor RsfS n=1 Tax=Leucobacter weissii TaxID=1983706 RepID=A0A939MJ63_9MICO|nr:ribosome silencing factor [Leucobacter weissii]MBO1901923.1 ribosome silencing factor [Leucobacter weissii]